MKYSKKKITKQLNNLRNYLKQEEVKRQRIIKNSKELVAVWKSEWDWEEESFIDDIRYMRDDWFISELENRGVKLKD